MSNIIIKSLLLGTALVFTGCASTATGVSTSKLSKVIPEQTLGASVPQGTVLAVVRYPAFVEEVASDKYYDAYASTAIGGSPTNKRQATIEVEALGDGVILKSNYFALSLYKELAAKLPAHSVLLSPHAITLDDEGQLTSKPMTHAESLANVVTVDFTAYSYPDPKKMMNKEPLTFGDLVTPLVTVHSDYRGAAPTQGVRLASSPLFHTAASNGQDYVEDSLKGLETGRLEPIDRELDYIAHLKRETPLNVPRKSLSARFENDSAQSYPIEKVSLSKSALLSLNDASAGTTDPLKDAFSEDFANQVIAIINQTDIEKSILAGRAASIAQFDDSLAALTLVGSDSADYQSRLRYAERLLEAEKKYLSVQSLRLFDGTHNGEIGAQVRDMLQEEYVILERRRKLARQQNTATAFAIIGAVAAGGAIGTDSVSGVGELLLLDTLIQGTIFAGQTAFAKSRQSQAVGSTYLNSVAPALEAQTTVQVDLIDSNETITAIRYEDLSAKLQTLYNDSQRSLDQIATRCGYKHDGSTISGTWLGECSNGQANGAGVGIYRAEGGQVFEYYGYAENGLPSGAGYLLEHWPEGSRTLEGNFVAGQPDGIVSVTSASGSGLRRFSAGKDIGSAPSGSVAVSPFAGALPSLRNVSSTTAFP